MQFFYVKEDIELTLWDRRKKLQAVPSDLLEKNKIPLNRIYCGNVAWEYILAKRVKGESVVCILPEATMDSILKPKRIQAQTIGRSVNEQIEAIKPSTTEKFWRLALINGTGTMLGDTIVGASVLEHVLHHLKDQGLKVIVDVYLAWNARPDVPKIWRRTTGVNQVFESSPTVSELLGYDAFWDYSRLLAMPGYGSQHFADFYFNQFGIDPIKIPDLFKLPMVRASRKGFEETQAVLLQKRQSRPLVWVDPNASTPARSMPAGFMLKLLEELTSDGDLAVATAVPLPESIDMALRKRIIAMSDWTHGNLDRYLSALTLADVIVSVDTLALHVAMGCRKIGIGLFSLSDPAVRLKYSPQISGLLIPQAEKLPYWGRHKGDERWSEWQQVYEQAWNRLDVSQIVATVRKSLKCIQNNP